MNTILRKRLDMATRVRDFLRAHQTDVVGEEAGKLGLAKLEELLQRADVLVAQQRSGLAAARSTTMQRKEIRDTLQTALLKYLKAVSVAAARENTDLLAQFQMPHRNLSHRGFVAAVRDDAGEGDRAESLAREPRHAAEAAGRPRRDARGV